MDFLAKLFDSNKRDLARLRKVAERINELEQSIKALSEEQIKARIAEIRKEIRDGVERHGVTSKQVDDLLLELFALRVTRSCGGGGSGSSFVGHCC